MNTVALKMVLATGTAAALSTTAWGQLAAPLTLGATIRLPGVSGRIDHLGFDPASQRLFVAARGNNTVEVVDTASRTHLRSLSGFNGPQGVAVVPDLNAIAVANGGTGTLQLIDTQTFATRWMVNIGNDVDNVRYDARAKRLYVAAQAGLYAVDSATGKAVGRVAIDGHPESFQLESVGTRILANLPGRLSSTIVSSESKTLMVAARWPMTVCAENYPMALDETTSRLFAGCRRPARLVMVDTRSGKTVTSSEIVGDADDLFYDSLRHRVYVIGGDGFIDVVGRDGDRLNRTARVSTRLGARTGLWVQTQSRLYVAVPARGGAAAEIRVFDAHDKVR